MNRVVRMNMRKEHPMRKLPGCHCSCGSRFENMRTGGHDTENKKDGHMSKAKHKMAVLT